MSLFRAAVVRVDGVFACAALTAAALCWLNDFHPRAEFSAQNPLSDARFAHRSSRASVCWASKGSPVSPHFSPLAGLYVGLRGRPVGSGAPSDFRVQRDQTDASLCGGGDTLPQSHHHNLCNDAAADFTRWVSSCGADAPLRVLFTSQSFLNYLFPPHRLDSQSVTRKLTPNLMWLLISFYETLY